MCEIVRYFNQPLTRVEITTLAQTNIEIHKINNKNLTAMRLV
jgi:hypothetical protein